MRDERGKGIESKCRGRSVEENLKIWEEMKAGSEVGLANAMRFKMDMSVGPTSQRYGRFFIEAQRWARRDVYG